MFFDPRYLLFVLLPSMALAFFAQWWVRNAFKEASQIPNKQRITGAQAAQRVLMSANLNLRIEPTRPGATSLASGASPDLDDHYDPREKVLRLSPNVYGSASIAAIAVAAHEAGHALQDAEGYSLMRARTALVPAANIGSNFGFFLLFIGIIMQSAGIAWLGVLAFSLGVLFSLLTLPVELDASSRALKLITATGIVDNEELPQAKAVLRAAAFTYVAGLAAALLNLLYYISLAMGIGSRRN